MSDYITLRFVTCRGVASESIRMFQDGFWATHVETVMLDGTLLGAHFDGGVQARPKGYDASELVREEFVDVPVTSLEADTYYAFMREQVGKPYDVGAIVAMVFNRNWRDDDKWFCSELVAAGFCKCGEFPDHLAVELQRVTPRDVRLIVSSMRTK